MGIGTVAAAEIAACCAYCETPATGINMIEWHGFNYRGTACAPSVREAFNNIPSGKSVHAADTGFPFGNFTSSFTIIALHFLYLRKFSVRLE